MLIFLFIETRSILRHRFPHIKMFNINHCFNSLAKMLEVPGKNKQSGLSAGSYWDEDSRLMGTGCG